VARLTGLELQTERAQEKSPVQLHRASLPLLGSNQDSPDPEGPLEHPEPQQLATIYARSCPRCWSLTAEMQGFAVLHSLKCRSLLEPRDPSAG
jgi:hypothetical protein